MLHTQRYFISNNINESNFDKARRFFFTKKVKISYDPPEASDCLGRVIFSTAKSARNRIDNIYVQESNGLILEFGTWNILCYPPRTLCNNIQTDMANRYLHQGLYHIYKSQDGTCFNMYYYVPKPKLTKVSKEEVKVGSEDSKDAKAKGENEANQESKDVSREEMPGRWLISTTSGYDMENVEWNGISYGCVLDEILSKYGYSWDEFTAKLRKDHCYSFGFKHPKFHPFREGRQEPIYKLWFIQSVDLNPASQTYLWATDFLDDKDKRIDRQEVLSQTIGNMKELYKEASEAYTKYISSMTVSTTQSTLDSTNMTADVEMNKETNKDAGIRTDTQTNKDTNAQTNKDTNAQRYEHKIDICYGFILRSVNPTETGYSSDLFVESSLMRHLRHLWYDANVLTRRYDGNFTGLSVLDRERVIPLVSYLDNNVYEIFSRLFPQHKDLFNSFGDRINKLVVEFVRQCRLSSKAKQNPECKQECEIQYEKAKENTKESTTENTKENAHESKRPDKKKKHKDIKHKKSDNKDASNKDTDTQTCDTKCEVETQESAEEQAIQAVQAVQISSVDKTVKKLYEMSKNEYVYDLSNKEEDQIKLAYRYIINMRFFDLLYEYLFSE